LFQGTYIYPPELANKAKVNFSDTTFACQEIVAVILEIIGIGGCKTNTGNDYSLLV